MLRRLDFCVVLTIEAWLSPTQNTVAKDRSYIQQVVVECPSTEYLESYRVMKQKNQWYNCKQNPYFELYLCFLYLSILEPCNMNTVKDLESAALKEKLLQVLRNDNLRKIIELTEYLMSDSEKIGVVMERINKILEDKVIHKRVYYPTEWAAAYVIAHEYDTLKRLVEINENSFIKQKYSQLLANKIRDAIYNLHNLIDELVKEIKKTNDDNTYDIIA